MLCCVSTTVQGMPIDSSVAELITAQLFVLVQEAPEPIYFYINSTGIAVSSRSSRGSSSGGSRGGNSMGSSRGGSSRGEQQWQEDQMTSSILGPRAC